MTELAAEDKKLVTLARSTRARTGAEQGAALRDSDGRTYAAASIRLPSLRLSAVQVCVAMALSSGARGLEAAVLLTDEPVLGAEDAAALRDVAGDDLPVHLVDARGALCESTRSGAR